MSSTADGNPRSGGRDETKRLLAATGRGDLRSAESLFGLLYDDLRAIARKIVRIRGGTNAIRPTSIVHEAFLRLVPSDARTFESEKHFLAAAARAMRHALVDHLRAANAEKRGGRHERMALDRVVLCFESKQLDVLSLHEAIAQLGARDVLDERIAEQRLFGGLAMQEIANILGLTKRTLERKWRFVRARLLRALEDKDRDGS